MLPDASYRSHPIEAMADQKVQDLFLARMVACSLSSKDCGCGRAGIVESEADEAFP